MMSSRRRAFTLIELLVVIAIIALLIGILIPALGSARATGRTTKCLANVRSFALAANVYAGDYKDSIWDATRFISFNSYTVWARLPRPDAPTVTGPGLVYRYMDDVEHVGECPTNKRRDYLGRDNRAGNASNPWGGQSGIDFDYTFINRMQGARLDADVRMGYLTRPVAYGIGVNPPEVAPATLDITRFTGRPVFVEESTRFYNGDTSNAGYQDGLFANDDQLETRHGRGGSMAFLEGHATLFQPPNGGDKNLREPADMDTWDLYAVGRQGWTRLEPPGLNTARRPFGWINNPRATP